MYSVQATLLHKIPGVIASHWPHSTRFSDSHSHVNLRLLREVPHLLVDSRLPERGLPDMMILHFKFLFGDHHVQLFPHVVLAVENSHAPLCELDVSPEDVSKSPRFRLIFTSASPLPRKIHPNDFTVAPRQFIRLVGMGKIGRIFPSAIEVSKI